METTHALHDRELRDHRISERVAVLSGQIQDIADSSARYRAKAVHTRTDRSANQLRELRLLGIREELGQLLQMGSSGSGTC
jgi:hypothetical protein